MAGRLQKAEDTLFATVEKLVQTATLASHRRNLRTASNCLRRAYAICTKQVEAGSVAGRLARAMVTLQLCALSSKAGRHAEALEEALKAVLEAEEVWSAMHDGTANAEVSPSWSSTLVSRALAALVQAKHCVAIELEYNLAEKKTTIASGNVPEVEMIRDQMIPALHQEASALARHLPSSSALRRLSERTQAQEASRRGAEVGDPVDVEILRFRGGKVESPGTDAGVSPATPSVSSGPPAREIREIQRLLPLPAALASPSQGPGRRASVLPSQVAQSVSKGLETTVPKRPQSAPSSFSMARIQRLEEQALLPPERGNQEDWRLPTLDLPLLQEPAMPLTDGATGSIGAASTKGGSRKGGISKASGAERRPREETGLSVDVFQDWLDSNRHRLPKGFEGKSLSEPMLKSLKEDFKLRYRRFQEEMPYFSAQDLYENKIMFSHYGMKIRSQANKDKQKSSKEEKPPRDKSKRDKSRSRWATGAHHQNLLSVKSLATMLKQSHDNHPLKKEFFTYVYGRPWRDEEIFESLRLAFNQAKET